MTTPRLSARVLQRFLPRAEVRALQSAAQAVTASTPQAYSSISNDSGATWSPVSTTGVLTFTFFRGGATIATAVITGTRNNGTGNVTITSVLTGEPLTVTLSGNATQVASAVIVHDTSMAQTSAVFQSLKDGTALGGFTGGGGK